MDIQTVLKENISAVLSDIYGLENQRADLQATRPEFAGDLTLLAFPYVRASRKSPRGYGARDRRRA